MGNINTSFFDALDAAATWSAGVAFKRSKGLPLDKYSVFESKALAIEYAEKRGAYSETPVSYPGQVIAVAEGSKMVAYVLAENAEGTKLELQQIGIIPTGDGKTISVTEAGVISLLATDAQVDEKNEAGEATGNKVVNAGAQLVLQSDGTLKWVQPDTSTAEGQAAAISALQGRMTTAEGDIDKLEAKVGTPAEGQEGTLFELIAAEAARAAEAEQTLDNAIKAIDFVDNDELTGAINGALEPYAKTADVNTAIDNAVKGIMGEGIDEAYNTLKEIQDILAGTDGEAIDGLIETVDANKQAIATLNGTGDGSVDKKIADAISGANLDQYVEDTEFATYKSEVTSAIGTAKSEATGYTDTKLADYYTKDDIAGLNHATSTDVENAVKAEADIARKAEKKNEDAIAAIKDHETVDSFADVVAELAKKQDKLAEGAYATESFVEAKVKVAAEAAAAADAKGTQGIADAAAALVAAQAAQTTANTNAANTDELEKVLYGRVITGTEAYPETVETGLIGNVADARTRLATAEGQITALEANSHKHTSSLADIEDAVAKKHAHTFVESELNLIKAGDVAKWNAAEQAAKNYADGLAANYATKEQGAKADTAVQSVVTGSANGTIAVDGADVAVKGLGTAAFEAKEAFDAAGAAGAVLGTAVDTATAVTVYGAIALANEKIAGIEAADKSVDVKVTEKLAEIKVNISATENNALELADDGLKVIIPEVDVPEYSIVKDTNSGDFAAVYHLTKDGANIGTAINIPKDMVVESGEVVTYTEETDGQAAGTYIKLKLQNVADALYVNVGDLIEYVTSGSQTGDMVVVNVSDDHKVTATITDGTIGKTKLTTDVQTSLGLADTAVQPADIGTMAAEAAADYVKKSEAEGYADILTKTAAQGLYQAKGDYASAAQGAKADTAIQSVQAGTGLKVTADETDATKLAVSIDETVVFIFDGGSATTAW